MHLQLLQAMESLPSILNSQRSAQFDELAIILETYLLKLSRIRARAHMSLYQYTLPSQPDVTMEKALNAMQERLRHKQRQQEKEETQLDQQIQEFGELLQMVDGKNGNFSQVIEDMARVRKETEECRRDLRRLGWTGD